MHHYESDFNQQGEVKINVRTKGLAFLECPVNKIKENSRMGLRERKLAFLVCSVSNSK